MQLPAYLQSLNLPDYTDRVAANLGQSVPPYLSISESKFTAVDAAGNKTPVGELDSQRNLYVDVIIADVLEVRSKIYYDAYDPTNPKPPICFSDNGIGPSKAAHQPQASTCADCPNSFWGSAVSKVTGEGVPACADVQKIALFIPQIGMEMLFLMRIPPNSLNNFKVFSEKFRNQGFGMAAVVTRLTFESGGALGKIVFTPIGFISEQQGLLVGKAVAAKAADGILNRGDKPRGLPAPAQPLALPAQAPSTGVFPAMQPAPVPTTELQAPAQPAPIAQPAVQAPAPRRRGRPPANQAASAPAPTQAPFPHAAPAPQPAANSGAPFGMQNDAPAPNPEMMATIKGMFG